MMTQYHVFGYDTYQEPEIIEELLFSTNTEKQANDFIAKDKNYNLSYNIRKGELVEDDEGGYTIQ